MLRGLYDARGQRIAGTRNDNGGEGADARLTFTATESGTHYIAARSAGPGTGTYTVRVTEADDFTADTGTAGTVAVGGSATGVIEKRNDIDWFAVELVAGQTYVIGLEGTPSGGGTLGDAMLRGLYDARGMRVAGTRNDDGGEGADARLTFTASASGTHYIAARSSGPDTGTYTVRVTPLDTDATAAGATDLGDLAGLDGMRVHKGSVDGGADGTDYYRFTLSEAQRVILTLRQQDADADLYLEDAEGNVLTSSTHSGIRMEGFNETLQAGTYHVRVVAQEEGDNAYNLRYRVRPPEVEAPAETPVGILDYSDPQWADGSFDYGKGWAGRGFGLTGSQRGAPEQIGIAEVDGVTALRFNALFRNRDWYDDHPGAVGHDVYGARDTDHQDDFFFKQSPWTAGDEPYLIAQLHLGSSRHHNFTSLRMPARYENGSGDEVRSFPGIFYYDDLIKLRGPGRKDISVTPPDHAGKGWVTLGMAVTESGDIIYVGKYGTHKLAELFADPDFEYRNSEISQQAGYSYFPVIRQGDASGMFSQAMLGGSRNAIAYIEYGTNLAVDTDGEPDGKDQPGDTPMPGRVPVGLEAGGPGAYTLAMEEDVDAM